MSEFEFTSQKNKLSFEKVSVIFTHRKQQIVAIQNLSFSIGDKEFICIVGPSGCGKSTVVNLIAGFIRPTTGLVYLNGHIIQGPDFDRGVVFQKHSLFPWKTVYENIDFGLRIKGLPKNKRYEIVCQYLKSIGLAEFEKSYPHELSVGMQQRVGLARAYANDPEILLMDEPFASLDAQTAIQMQELLLKIWTQNPKTVIFVTHNIDEAILLADRILLFTPRPGKIETEISINLPRPRSQRNFEDLHYLELRKKMIDLLFGNSVT